MVAETRDRSLAAIGIGGRLADGAGRAVVDSAGRLEASDASILDPGLHAADIAHTVALLEAGVMPRPVGRRLLRLLLALREVDLGERPADPRLGDAFANRQAWLSARDPEAGGWLCAGRARREGTTVAYHIAVRDRLLGLAEATISLGASLVAVAEANVRTLMPDYTYLQHAQPTTLAHYLLSFAYPLLRDLDRIRECYERTNRSPAGGGAITGTRWPIDRGRLASLLGFDGVVTHTRDAMWQADQPVEVLSVVTSTVLTADRLAEDLQVWATAEFNLIELADRHARGSMVMPQKKNPYALAFVRGVASSMIGRLAGVAAAGRTPSGQVDNRIFVYGEVPRALDIAAETVRLMGDVAGALSVNRNLMESRALAGWAQATDLAEAIVARRGLDYRTAHRIVGRTVRLAVERGLAASDISPSLLDEAAVEFTGLPLGLDADAVAHAMDAWAGVVERRGIGGAGPRSVEAMLADCRAALGAARRWREGAWGRLVAAACALDSRARELAEGGGDGQAESCGLRQ